MTREGLIQAYESYGKPDEQWRVGAEFERHLLGIDGMPLPYYGEPGVRWLLMRFVDRGWAPYMEGDHPIALSKDGARITLEPGGQFELSGAPWDDVSGVDVELERPRSTKSLLARASSRWHWASPPTQTFQTSRGSPRGATR